MTTLGLRDLKYALRSLSRSFEELALHQGIALNLTGTGDPVRIMGGRVTPTLFDVLGVSERHRRVGR